LTPEEVRQNARWAEQARQAREQADADAKRVKAKADAERERAMELLREHLDEEQREQLEAKGEFEVESQNGNRYAIKKGYAGNVFRLDAKRKRVTQYCIHPVDLVPDGDAMLAQMCWIKWNEEQFLKVANATRLAA
jgi:serine phosphatase RsbU (regulator of sigma subunit)